MDIVTKLQALQGVVGHHYPNIDGFPSPYRVEP